MLYDSLSVGSLQRLKKEVCIIMPSENLTVAKILTILAWVVLGLGLIGVIAVFLLNPTFTMATLLPLILSLVAVLVFFVTLNVLARILRTVTYLYQLSWEQFKELGEDIDELDGKLDGTDGAQCPYCGALVVPDSTVCTRCGKPYSIAEENKK